MTLDGVRDIAMDDYPVTVHEFVEHGWAPPHSGERLLSCTQVRDYVIVLTDRAIYQAQRNYDGFIVMLIGHIGS